jgi:hypothetical protein
MTAMLIVVGVIGTAGLSMGTAQAAPIHVTASHGTPGPSAPEHMSTNPANFKSSEPGRHASSRGGNTITGTSTTWDGYALTGLSGSSTTYNEVQAEWVEPTATCDPNANTQLAVFWVGLDGFGTSSVEQGGTIASCQNGTPQYNVWWEMFPFNFITADFSINAGDTIKASVTFDPATSEFDIVVADLTSGQTLTEDTPCQPGQNGCTRETAEVISEDPQGSGDLDNAFPLTNYGTNTFTQASVTDSTGHTGTLSDPAWQTFDVSQVSSAGVTKQTTSPLSADGSSFTTTWQAESGDGSVPPQAAVLYQTGVTAPSTNVVQPNINLVNTGSSPIPLSAVTIRYWFTEDGTQPLEYACDFVPIGCSNISGAFFGVSPVNGADHYLQISFGPNSGVLLAGQQTGTLQSRIWQQNFANMTQTNDYSYNASDTSNTLNPHITVYDNGQLIYGTEPS